MGMDDILNKLKYKDQGRIALLNAPDDFMDRLVKLIPGVLIDTVINARFLYDFMIAFTPRSEEVDKIGPACVHNLNPDGKLWLAFPKITSNKITTDISRDRGWNVMEAAGFRRVSQVSINEDWSALRFRNVRFIRSGKSSG
jgi:hypothetical protein